MRVFITVILSLIVVVGFGQDLEMDYHLKKHLEQDGLNWEVLVLDEDKCGVIKFSENKSYFWYRKQSVFSTQGGASGALLHGSCKAFHTNDQLAIEGRYRRGLKSGKWMSWSEEGVLSKIEYWCRGELKKVRHFDESGSILSTVKYKKGIPIDQKQDSDSEKKEQSKD